MLDISVCGSTPTAWGLSNSVAVQLVDIALQFGDNEKLVVRQGAQLDISVDLLQSDV